MWDYIDKASQVVGIISAIPVFYSAFILYRFYRTKKTEQERIKKEPGERPGILIVDSVRSGHESIQALVKNWLWAQPEFQSKQNNTYIETAIFKGDLRPEDMDKMVKSVRTAVGRLQAMGVTKYHVFIRGPMPLAAVAGGVLYNYRPAVFYQQGNEGGYVCWGSINR